MTQRNRQLPGITIVPYVFGQDALAANQTDVQIPTAVGEASQAVAGYTMPVAGEVLYLTANLSAAGSAGNLSVGATIDGTEDADSTIAITTETAVIKTLTRDSMVFTAGAVLGVEITTDGSWNGTTADLLVVAYVALWL